jgi:hypothetical protein
MNPLVVRFIKSEGEAKKARKAKTTKKPFCLFCPSCPFCFPSAFKELAARCTQNT